jgi:hypothetical protein
MKFSKTYNPNKRKRTPKVNNGITMRSDGSMVMRSNGQTIAHFDKFDGHTNLQAEQSKSVNDKLETVEVWCNILNDWEQYDCPDEFDADDNDNTVKAYAEWCIGTESGYWATVTSADDKIRLNRWYVIDGAELYGRITVNGTCYKCGDWTEVVEVASRDCEDTQQGFLDNGTVRYLMDFVPTNNPHWCNLPEYHAAGLHAMDVTMNFHPDFIELSNDGWSVRLWSEVFNVKG